MNLVEDYFSEKYFFEEFPQRSSENNNFEVKNLFFAWVFRRHHVANDPVNWIDPSGLCPWCIVGGVVAGLLYPTDTDTPGAAQSEMIGVPLAVAGGYAAGLAATSQYSIRGGELVITRGGQQTRINPTGDANSCQPGGKLPHYHRSTPDPMNPGQSIPGQGIGRHRPWDVRSTDRSFWDRF